MLINKYYSKSLERLFSGSQPYRNARGCMCHPVGIGVQIRRVDDNNQWFVINNKTHIFATQSILILTSSPPAHPPGPPVPDFHGAQRVSSHGLQIRALWHLGPSWVILLSRGQSKDLVVVAVAVVGWRRKQTGVSPRWLSPPSQSGQSEGLAWLTKTHHQAVSYTHLRAHETGAYL
eukprot:8466481-Pyramimonas_sp.AAC.1